MAARGTSRRASSGNSGPPLAVPDTLGDSGRARLGAMQLLNLQEKRRTLDNTQVIEERDDDDIVPGLLNDGKTVLFKDRREQIDKAIGRLVAAHEDIREEFDKQVERLREERFG